MSSNYERCKKSIYTYKSKNVDKIKEYNNKYCKQYYQYHKELKEFMNILLDTTEKEETYYSKNKADILEKKKLYYQKKKASKEQTQ